MKTALPHIASTLSESEFQRIVIDFALLMDWRCHHSRPAQVRPGKYVTAIQGHVGLPDLVLARDGQVLLVELKRTGGRVTSQQQAWLTALGRYGRVWTPADWNSGLIIATLRDGLPIAGAA